MIDQTKQNQGLSPLLVIAAIVIVVAAVGFAAFRTFGPQPEPHPRYNSADLIRRGQKDPNSLTPDERRVYNHITHSIGGPQSNAGAPTAQKP